MRRRLQLFTGFLSSLLVLMLLPVSAFAAAQATLTLSADKTTVNVGDQVKVTLNVSTTDFTAGSIEAKVSFDSGKLEYVSQDDSGSNYPNSYALTTGSGSVFVGRATDSSGQTGTGKVTSLVFKTKAGGNTTLTLSDLKIYELGTGNDKPLSGAGASTAGAGGSGLALTINGSTSAVTPKATAKPGTVKTTAKPSVKPVTTPAPGASVDPNAISPTQSTVLFGKTVATADGVDTISVSVTLRKNDGSIVTDIDKTPTLSGLRETGDAASPFALDESGEAWISQISSTEPGLITVAVASGDTVLINQDLTFEAPITGTPNPSDTGSSSFTRTLLIGFGILLLLLLLLFFLWRRLRSRGEEETFDEDVEDPNAPAFPGDESASEPAETPAAEAPATPPAEEKKEETAAFNPNEALQRHEEPEAPKENPDDTIQL